MAAGEASDMGPASERVTILGGITKIINGGTCPGILEMRSGWDVCEENGLVEIVKRHIECALSCRLDKVTRGAGIDRVVSTTLSGRKYD